MTVPEFKMRQEPCEEQTLEGNGKNLSVIDRRGHVHYELAVGSVHCGRHRLEIQIGKDTACIIAAACEGPECKAHKMLPVQIRIRLDPVEIKQTKRVKNSRPHVLIMAPDDGFKNSIGMTLLVHQTYFPCSVGSFDFERPDFL
jgi:hypothetical protein